MKQSDEYKWSQYTAEYSAQLEQIKREDKQDFFITSYTKKGNEIIEFKDKLHPNWKEIYATAFRLKPASIFEAGVGAQYHLKNLFTLLPDARISGCDLLQSQLDFGKIFSNLPEHIFNSLRVMDLTKPIKVQEQYEFVYTQAVIMHLSTENAMAFLQNLDKLSSKYILLIEGTANHANWYNMVRMMLPGYDFQLTSKFIHYGVLLTKRNQDEEEEYSESDS